jgi:hypothetical protein
MPSRSRPNNLNVPDIFIESFVLWSLHFFLLAGLAIPGMLLIELTKNTLHNSWGIIFLTLPIALANQAIVFVGAFEAYGGRILRLARSPAYIAQSTLSFGLVSLFTTCVMLIFALLPVLTVVVVLSVFHTWLAQHFSYLTQHSSYLMFAAFMVPALILWSAFGVSFQSCFIERVGPIDGMRRSLQLSKGFRWQLFALTLSVTLFLLAINFICVTVGSLLPISVPSVAAVASIARGAINSSFISTTMAVTYCRLRRTNFDEFAAALSPRRAA